MASPTFVFSFFNSINDSIVILTEEDVKTKPKNKFCKKLFVYNLLTKIPHPRGNITPRNAIIKNFFVPAKNFFSFGDQNEASAGLKFLGFFCSIIGLIILYCI